MEIIENFRGTRAILFYLLLFFLNVGILLIIAGIRIWKRDRRTGWVYIGLGIIFCLFLLYVMFFVFIFGFNS